MKKGSDNRRERAKTLLSKCGYSSGGATHGKSIPKNVKKAAKMKTGGYVQGDAPKARLDKPGRKSHDDAFALPKVKKEKYARGGAAKGKTVVNVIVSGKDDAKGPAAPSPVPVPVPAGASAPVARPMPPMPPAGAGVPPRPMMNRGGKIKENPKYPIDDGSGGGLGRLEKAAAAKKTHGGKKRGK